MLEIQHSRPFWPLGELFIPILCCNAMRDTMGLPPATPPIRSETLQDALVGPSIRLLIARTRISASFSRMVRRRHATMFKKRRDARHVKYADGGLGSLEANAMFSNMAGFLDH